ncbi:MAG TPA: PQQ-binding-like beta-propeller repeat protein [Gemmatimonadales bacterium]|nr:PQQ-binding-like beta-propeller repeat protein [Gemmatimonadales bacterium]
MSKGALSLALLFGTVNAACARAVQAPPPAPTLESTGTSGAPQQVWRSKASRRFTGSLVLAGESIYGGGMDRKVVAVDLATGKQRWTFRLGGIIGGGVVVGGDTVFAATTRPEGRVTALEGKTGRRVWRTTTGPVNAPLALIGGTLVVENQKGEIFALNAATGDIRWRRKLGVARIPAVAGDSGTVIVATVDSLFRVNAASGKVVRRAGSPGAVVAPWIRHGALLIGGTTDSLVVAVDPDSLITRWQVTLDAPVLSSPASAGDTVLAVSRRGSLYRVVPGPTPQAQRVAELDWPVTAPVSIVDGLVLLGGADGTLRALRSDGSEAWRLQLPWPVDVGVLELPDGMVAAGGDGDLHRYGK